MPKTRPARQQVETRIDWNEPEQSGITYNLWYNSWSGGDRFDAASRQPKKAPTRVNIAKDAGYTQGDAMKSNIICIWFARGCCPNGCKCRFLHRLPDPQPKIADAAVDCFGRTKFADYREDHGGQGSLLKVSRTLFVSKIVEKKDTASIIEKHFKEFGHLERIRVVSGRGIAFVTYAAEASAQFAQEAMSHQSLDSGEVLIIKWASNEDAETRASNLEYIHRIGDSVIANKLDPQFVLRVKAEDEGWAPETQERKGITTASNGTEPRRDAPRITGEPPKSGKAKSGSGGESILGDVSAIMERAAKRKRTGSEAPSSLSLVDYDSDSE